MPRPRPPLPLTAYRMVGGAAMPLLRLAVRRRLAQGKEEPGRTGERFGHAGMPRPDGPLLWVHAASVGETLSVLPLIDRLRAQWPGLPVLLTTATRTSARLAAERAPFVIHRFAPWDAPRWVNRFLDSWRPDAAVWVESELWPTLIEATRRRGVPMALLNGRMSPRSFRRWALARGTARHLLSCFDLLLGQSREDCRRLAAMTGGEVAFAGHLKYAAPPLPVDEDELHRLHQRLGGRPVWLAASTHAGEEEIAGHAHRALAASHPGLLTIVAPRHPQRGEEVTATLTGVGLRCARRGAGQAPGPATEVYVADTVGEMGLFYRLAQAVFVGKSLAAAGGQNPLEPARLGRAVLFGPHMENFAEIAAAMTAAGAAREVADADDLARQVNRLLDDAALRGECEVTAAAFAAERAQGVLEETLRRLMPVLAPALDGQARVDGRKPSPAR